MGDTTSSDDSSKKYYLCLKCNDAVGDGEFIEDCIECHDCKQWCHKNCADLTQSQFDFLSVEGKLNEGIQWICKICLSGENEKKGPLEKKLDRMFARFLAVERAVEKVANATGENLEKKVEEMIDKKLEEKFKEREERQKRELNLIVVGLPESNKTESVERQADDLKRVQTMVDKICPDLKEKVEEPVRLGKVGGSRPRMLRIKVKSLGDKREIMRNAYKINKDVKDQKNRMYINPDYTPAEREKQKELRAEIKRRTQEGERDLKIRGDKIVQVRPPQAAQAAGRTSSPERN